jgi:hypothetical protein
MIKTLRSIVALCDLAAAAFLIYLYFSESIGGLPCIALASLYIVNIIVIPPLVP